MENFKKILTKMIDFMWLVYGDVMNIIKFTKTNIAYEK